MCNRSSPLQARAQRHWSTRCEAPRPSTRGQLDAPRPRVCCQIMLSWGCFGCLPSAGRPLPTHGCSSHPPALCGWHTRPMSDGSGLCAPPCALSMCHWCRHLLAQCARQPPRRRGQEAAAGCCGGQAHHTEALRGCGRWRLWGFGAFGRPRPLAPRPLPSAAQEGRDGRARACAGGT